MHAKSVLNLTADDAAELGDDVFDADHAAGAVLALRQQVAVHLVDDVADCLLSDLEVVRLRAVARRVHDGGHVHAAALADEPPDEARHERQDRLPSTCHIEAMFNKAVNSGMFWVLRRPFCRKKYIRYSRRI